MATTELESICVDLRAAQRHFEAVSLIAFRKLEKLDAELHTRVIETLENEAEAAGWFSDQLEVFNYCTAWDELLAGNRQGIIDALGRMEYGIPM